jgi:hypothetical protein
MTLTITTAPSEQSCQPLCSEEIITTVNSLIYLRAYSTGKVQNNNNNNKAIPVTGRGGPQSCEMSRLPQFVDNRLTDGGKVVSLTLRPPFTLYIYKSQILNGQRPDSLIRQG